MRNKPHTNRFKRIRQEARKLVDGTALYTDYITKRLSHSKDGLTRFLTSNSFKGVVKVLKKELTT